MIIDSYISLTKGNNDKEYVSNMISSLLSLGYSGAFLVTEIHNREIDEKDICDSSSLFHCLTPLQHTLLSTDEKVKASNEFQPFSRLSVTTGSKAVLNSLKTNIAASYDIVSICPLTGNIFSLACQSSFIDIIEIPLDRSLPFKVTKDDIDNALKHGILFEFTYASTLRDRSARRSLFSSSYNLIHFLRGNNILIGSDPQHPMEIRSPNDVITIASLLDIPYEKATAVLYKNPQLALLHAQRRKAKKGVIIESLFVCSKHCY